MRRLDGAVLLIIFMLILSGCAPRVHLSQADRVKIHTVSVSKKVTAPKEAYFLAPGAAVGLGFGAIGAIVTAAINVKPTEHFRQLIHANHFHIETIVRDQFVKQLKEKAPFRLVAHQPTTATFHLNIRQYGMSVPNGFSSKVTPVLTVVGTLIDNKTGELLWQNQESVLTLMGHST